MSLCLKTQLLMRASGKEKRVPKSCDLIKRDFWTPKVLIRCQQLSKKLSRPETWPREQFLSLPQLIMLHQHLDVLNTPNQDPPGGGQGPALKQGVGVDPDHSHTTQENIKNIKAAIIFG